MGVLMWGVTNWFRYTTSAPLPAAWGASKPNTIEFVWLVTRYFRQRFTAFLV
jgi:hypothetical protein